MPQPQAQHCYVPEASPEIPAEIAATAQTSEHDITLDSATPATGNANPGAKVAAIKCPESAHGDWMSVTRKAWKNPNPNQKKPLENPPKTARTTSGNQGGKKGNSQQIMEGSSRDISSGAMQFKAASDTAISINVKDNSHGRKRIRKENNNMGPRLEPVGDPFAPSSSMLQRGNQGKNMHATRMIGNHRVYVFEDGTSTTLNLQHQQGNRYALLEDDEGSRGQGEATNMVIHATADNPLDPGAAVADPNTSSR